MEKLIITDPSYFLKYGDEFDEDGNIFLKHVTNYVCSDTGFGDGLGYVEQNGEVIGTFGVDSGMFGIFKLCEVLKCKVDFLEKLPKNCYTILDGNIDEFSIERTQDENYLVSYNVITTW